jgi:hypothetical protein
MPICVQDSCRVIDDPYIKCEFMVPCLMKLCLMIFNLVIRQLHIFATDITEALTLVDHLDRSDPLQDKRILPSSV